MKLRFLIISLLIGGMMTGLSENVIDKFDFQGGSVDDLAEQLEISLRSSNLDIKLEKYYNDDNLQLFRRSFKDIPLRDLVLKINGSVGYKMLATTEDGGLVLYGNLEHFHSTATGAFELTDQIYISVSGDKAKLEALLSNRGILFNKEYRAGVVKISSDKPYVATIRNSTVELGLIDSLITLLIRVEKAESKVPPKEIIQRK